MNRKRNVIVKNIIAWFIVILLIFQGTEPCFKGLMDSVLVHAEEEYTQTDHMFNYTGGKSLYEGETVSLVVTTIAGRELKWECSDTEGKYVDWYTSEKNNTGTEFTMHVNKAEVDGTTIVISAICERDKCRQDLTLKLLKNDKFYFLRGNEKIEGGRADLSVGGSFDLSTNLKNTITFAPCQEYMSYTYTDNAGKLTYKLSNDEATQKPTNTPINAMSSYSFKDEDGKDHTIKIDLEIFVVDGLTLDKKEFSIKKGTDAGDTHKIISANSKYKSTPITWKVYKGQLTADEALEAEEVKKGITLKCSSSSSDYRSLNDIVDIALSKDLVLDKDSRIYTIVATQMNNDERAMNAVCYMNVLQPVTDLSLSLNETTLYLVGSNETSSQQSGTARNKSIIVTATSFGDTINGIDADDKTVVWTCTDTDVASIDTNGSACNVTALKPGHCVVVASSKDNPEASDVLYVEVAPKVSKVQITSEDMTVNLAEQYVQLFANVQSEAVDEQKDSDNYEAFKNALNTSVTWSSSNPGVASVDMYTGKVTLKSAGKVTIICASADDQAVSDSIVITVNVPVAAIALQDNYKKISVGQSFTLNYTLLSNYAGFEPSNKEVTWESSDNKVATVDNEGKVTGVTGGTATILCRADDGQITATCTVEVYQAVTRIDISDTSMDLNIGSEAVLEAAVYPTTASEQKVTWSSNKPEIVSVTQDGIIKANQIGDPVVITAYIQDKNATIKTTCIVNVVVPVTSISLSPTSKIMQKGETLAITKSITPLDATNATVIYGTTDANVATVDSKGNVKAIAGGHCYITARTINRDMMASVYITVDEKVEGITLSKASKIMKKGASYTMKAKVNNATATDQSLTFSSSNSKIVSVSSKGKIKAKKYGTATITCKAMDGSGVKAKCKITVRRYVSKIKLNATTKTVQIYKTYTLKPVISPYNADVKKVSWSTSNQKIATVKNGVVTAKAIGKCTITCKATDGSGKKAKCKIIVKRVVTNQKIEASKNK